MHSLEDLFLVRLEAEQKMNFDHHMDHMRSQEACHSNFQEKDLESYYSWVESSWGLNMQEEQSEYQAVG
jgi:hypothetical protein